MLKKILVTAAVAAMLSATGALAETIKIGVTPGEHAQIMEKVKEIAKPKGLDIEIFEFSDYVVPNQALNDGELVADRKFDLVDVANTVNFPMGVYSKKVKSFDALADGATIAIPNDPTNGGRALLILADKGVIKLKEGSGLKVTLADIVENKKNFKFVELDAAQLPRSIDDVDAAAINTNYALEAGLDPMKDPILKEGEKAPYVNLIAVRKADKDKPWVKTLIESYHSDPVKQFILDKYKGAAVPAW
jgi:D-methionine transport system substrate-binding protein